MQAWLTRTLTHVPQLAQSHGPQLASLLFALLIACEGARVALIFVHATALPPPPALASQSASKRVNLVDVQSIVGRHLFGVAADDSAQDSANAALAAANVVLLGTIATEDPARGVAIVTIDGPAKVFSVGEQLAGGALHAVYLDHVVLNRGGRLETVYLPRLLLANGRAWKPPVADQGMHPPENLGETMGLDPSVDMESGALLGFRLRRTGGKSSAIPGGLQAGDILTAVNGESLTDQDQEHGESIVNNMLASNHAIVSVLRNGIPTDVTVNLGR
jgi:general secretion pathway protein C